MNDALEVCHRLFEAYGPRHWWPGDGPFEVIVGAILTQNTAWTNVEKAIANLRAARVLSAAGLAGLSPDELAELIRPAGYFRAKSRALHGFVDHLFACHGGELARIFAAETGALREELLALRGVGPETADSILLYAAERPVFVIDAYTVRIGSRLGWGEPGKGYDWWQHLFESALPRDATLFNEYHALLVHHGKYVCRARGPLCDACVVAHMCPRVGIG